ncbi:DUF362 domain-containing protein [candidate division CSSED10-310 bacterium]|uniref:DUF362 domain-containing protein n=1 Tax=candidate division CSSED10-310 bacterium TaxID=2855610 RepID=A0ABV6Z3G3_UNCC1
MSPKEPILTRRDFMKDTTYLTLGTATGLSLTKKAHSSARAKVILVRNNEAHDSDARFNADIIQKMLDQAMSALCDTKDALEAWKTLLKPTDIVGIKSNVWSYLPTPSALEQAIKKRIKQIGVAESNMGVDDRGVRQNPIFQKATAMINVRPLRTHHWSGIGGTLKNPIMFVEKPYLYHGNSCADLAKIWKLPILAGKIRLNILSVLKAQFHGRGPHHFDRRYVWDYNGLIVGTDPVAVDAVGLKIIQAKRRAFFGEEKNLQTTPHHILYAETRHHLGVSDLNRIDLIKIGPAEGMLI